MRRTSITLALLLGSACAPSTLAPAGSLGPDPKLASAEPEAGSAVLWPDEPFRAQRPAARPAAPLQLPSPNRFTTDEGMEVLLVSDATLPIVRIELVWETGAVADPAGREGTADVCLDLLDEGTRRLDRVAFEEAQDDIGVQIRSAATSTTVSLSMSALAPELEAGVELMGELLGTPGMRSTDFGRLVEDRVQGLTQSRATHRGISGRVLPRLLHGADHPYGRQTTQASLEKIRLADCFRIVRSLGVRGARVYASGAIDEARLRAALGGGLARNRRPAPTLPEIPAASPARGVYLVDLPESSQSTVVAADIGPARDAPEYAANQIMTRVLGGGFSSRINMNLREDKGFSYGARSSLRYPPGAPTMVTSARVRADATSDAIGEIIREIDRMRNGVAADEEFRRERDGELASLPAGFATASAIARSYRTLDQHGLPSDWYAAYERELRALTSADLDAAARTVLPEAPAVVLVIGDGVVVREGLERFAATLGENLIELDSDGWDGRGP